MLLSVSCPPDWATCFEFSSWPDLGWPPSPTAHQNPHRNTLAPARESSFSSGCGCSDFRAPSLAKRKGRWVGEGLGECPVRVRFHDDGHQMTERTDLITSECYDRLSSFGDDIESSTRLPSGLLIVKLTYDRVLCVENLARRSPRIGRANQTRTPAQIQFDSFTSEPDSS